MSDRPQITPYPVFNSTTGQSMAGNLTSTTTIIQKLSMISYGISWSGTSPVGTLSAQISNDYSLNANGSVKNTGTWTTIPLNSSGVIVTSLPISGNTGNGFIDIFLTSGYALQLVYTATSGTGTLSATLNAKVS